MGVMVKIKLIRKNPNMKSFVSNTQIQDFLSLFLSMTSVYLLFVSLEVSVALDHTK
jgi:hypothetical protein